MFLAKSSKSQGGGLINKHLLNKQNSNTHLSSTGSKSPAMYPRWGAMEEGSTLKYLSNAAWFLNKWERPAFGGDIRSAAVVPMYRNSAGVSPPPSIVR